MRNRRGVTLVELAIMIGVAAVLFISIGRAVLTLNEKAIENRDYLIALNLAKRQMAIMNNAAYPVAAVEAALSADANFPSFIPTQEVTNIVTNGSDTINRITVRIRLNSLTGPVLIRLDTYRTNVVSFGNGT